MMNKLTVDAHGAREYLIHILSAYNLLISLFGFGFQTCERENTLRKQLSEASKRLEEQNLKFDLHDEKIKASNNQAEKYAQEAEVANERIKKMQVWYANIMVYDVIFIKKLIQNKFDQKNFTFGLFEMKRLLKRVNNGQKCFT